MLRNLQNFVPGPFSGGRKIESTGATMLLCFVGRAGSGHFDSLCETHLATRWSSLLLTSCFNAIFNG